MFSTYELCKLQIERADDRENLVVLDLRLMEAAENGLGEHRGDSEGIFLRSGQTTPFGFDLCHFQKFHKREISSPRPSCRSCPADEVDGKQEDSDLRPALVHALHSRDDGGDPLLHKATEGGRGCVASGGGELDLHGVGEVHIGAAATRLGQSGQWRNRFSEWATLPTCGRGQHGLGPEIPRWIQ